MNEKPQSPITKAHLEGVDNLSSRVYDMLAMWYNNSDKTPESLFAIVKSNMQFFLTTYGINLLNATLEAGPGEKTDIVAVKELKVDDGILWIGIDADIADRFTVIVGDDTFNTCRSSYRLAIDEGIKEISK